MKARLAADGGVALVGSPGVPALGLGKVLAVLAIVWPGLPRLKEWAYAGAGSSGFEPSVEGSFFGEFAVLEPQATIATATNTGTARLGIG